MRRLRWGILSAAKIAREHVIPAMRVSRSAEVVAIASRDRARAAAVAARHDIAQVFDRYEALLDAPDVDAIYIATPNTTHVAWTLRALAAGKHVLCEKPMAMEAREIDAVIAARDRAGRVLAEAFMVAYHPQWHFVREALAQGRIGRLRLVESSFTYRNLDPANIRNTAALGGGALRDIGVYPVVTTRVATGAEPHAARARIERDPTFGTDRLATCLVDFDTFTLSFYCGTQLAARQHMTFHGETGWLRLDAPFNAGRYDQARVLVRNDGESAYTETIFPQANQYQLMIEHFADVVHGGTELHFPVESSRANQRVIDLLFASDRVHDGAGSA